MEKIKNHFNYRIVKDSLQTVPVEIIMPYHGQTQFVSKFLESVFSNLRDTKYIITLVDDASPNREFLSSILKANVPGVRGLRNSQHSGFGYSVNNALKNPFTKNIPLVAIMHSDVEIHQPTWLSSLNKTLNELKHQNVKMISSLTNNPTNNLVRLQAEKNIEKDTFILAEDEFIPMYSCLAHRELFQRVGLLKEYACAGGEVQEFALSMRKNGFFQAACGKSWVYHEGEGTLRHVSKNSKIMGSEKITEENFDDL